MKKRFAEDEERRRKLQEELQRRDLLKKVPPDIRNLPKP
jgi:hypothetical protein